MVCSVWLQKFSLSITRCRRISLGVFLLLVSLFIIMNFACSLKLWLFSWKCLHAHMVLGWRISTSFPWLFSLTLKSVSVFPIYCFYITFIQSSIWHIRGNNSFREKSCFLSLVTLLWFGCSTEFCYLQNTGSISLLSKYFCLFSLQCCFRYCYCQWVPSDFCCIWKL